eukprot:m.632137 g.632137  ORF g.632137 m.632137 type:complete len:90 (-) comp22577_c0_seq3:3485-3754(-)
MQLIIQFCFYLWSRVLSVRTVVALKHRCQDSVSGGIITSQSSIPPVQPSLPHGGRLIHDRQLRDSIVTCNCVSHDTRNTASSTRIVRVG